MKKLLVSILVLIIVFALSSAGAAPTVAEMDTAARGSSSLITICGNEMYYSYVYDIYRMNLNGTGKKRVYKNPLKSEPESGLFPENLQSHGGYVYYEGYEGDGTIYRFKPGAKSPSVYLRNAQSYIIGGDMLYYGTPSEKNIMSINLKTGKKETILTGTRLYPQTYVDGLLLYKSVNKYGLYNPETKKHRVSADNLWLFQARGSYVFFSSNNVLHRAKLDKVNLKLTNIKEYARISGKYYMFISGDNIYSWDHSRDSMYTTVYRQSMATGKSSIVGEVYDQWDVQPCGNYIHGFHMKRGDLIYQGSMKK